MKNITVFSKKCFPFVMTFLNVKGDLKCGASLIFKISERDDTFYVDVMVWTKLSMARTANIIRLWIKVIWMTKYFTQSILEKEIIINEKAFLILLLNRQQVYRDASNTIGHLNLTGHVPRLSKGKLLIVYRSQHWLFQLKQWHQREFCGCVQRKYITELHTKS